MRLEFRLLFKLLAGYYFPVLRVNDHALILQAER